MINLLYLDDDNNIIEEIEEIHGEKDYKLNKLYFVIDLQSELNHLQSLTNINILDFQKIYNLNHLHRNANVIYITSESNILLIKSRLIECINTKSKNKIENLFHELKDNSVLNVFLEKRELVIEKKEQLLKIFSECKTLLEILNNIYSLNDLDLIK